MTRVLIATPTYSGKEYCRQQFLDALLNLKVQKESVDLTILIMENTSKDFDISYWEKLNDAVKGLGDRVWVSHIVFNPMYPIDYRLQMLFNMAAGIVKDYGYDYLFIVEADVILNEHDLHDLLTTAETGARVVSGVTAYPSGPEVMVYKELADNEGDAPTMDYSLPIVAGGERTFWLPLKYPQQKLHGHFPRAVAFTKDEAVAKCGTVEQVRGFSLGCCLIHRSVLERVPFRCSYRGSAYPDILFSMDCNAEKILLTVNWNVRPEHLARPWEDETYLAGTRPEVAKSNILILHRDALERRA